MRTRNKHLAAAVALVALVFTFTSCEEAPGTPLESSKLKSAKPGHVVRDGNILRIEPGAVAVIDGRRYANEVPIADVSIAAVVKDGIVYFWHSDMSDEVRLSRESSNRALALYIYGAATDRQLNVASAVGYDYRTTRTGLLVRQRVSGRYEFKNPQLRWHAVVSEPEGRARFLIEKTLFGIDWFGAIAHGNYLFQINVQPSVSVAVDESDIELYGGILKGVAGIGVFATIPFTVIKYIKATLAGAEQRIFAHLFSVEMVSWMMSILDEIVGEFPLGDCLSVLLNPLLAAVEDHLHTFITGEISRSEFTDYLNAAVEPFMKCAITIAGAKTTGPIVPIIRLVVWKISALAWAVEDVSAKWDVIGYEAYTRIDGEAKESTVVP